jgi:hypothetical protein
MDMDKLCKKGFHQMTDENTEVSISGLTTCRECTKEMIKGINSAIIEKAFAETAADALLIQTSNAWYIADEGSIIR